MDEVRARRFDASGARPRVSFVAAWQGCPNELSRRLRIWDRWIEDGIDVVVVSSCPAGDRERIERSHPDVRVVIARPDEDLSTLRQLGVSAAQGDIVVIIDDTIGWTLSWRDQLPFALGGASLAGGGRQWVGYERGPHAIDEASLR